jgi:hypothetical protein
MKNVVQQDKDWWCFLKGWDAKIRNFFVKIQFNNNTYVKFAAQKSRLLASGLF